MGYMKNKVIGELNKKCDCVIKSEHTVGDHDACCQLCGGSHIEMICPQRKLDDIKQMLCDLKEIVTFKIDDNDIRDDAKRLINNIEQFIKNKR